MGGSDRYNVLGGQRSFKISADNIIFMNIISRIVLTEPHGTKMNYTILFLKLNAKVTGKEFLNSSIVIIWSHLASTWSGAVATALRYLPVGRLTPTYLPPSLGVYEELL
jgi:hypothetical protein